MARKKDQKLTSRQRRFVGEYLLDQNGTQAAIRAGYSKQSARQIAYELLSKPHIKRALGRRVRTLEAEGDRGILRLVEELKAIAYLDPRDIVSWDGDTITYRNSDELPPAVAAAVKSIKPTADGVQITFYSKLDAIEKLAKWYKMYQDGRERVGGIGEINVLSLRIGDRVLPPQRRTWSHEGKLREIAPFDVPRLPPSEPFIDVEIEDDGIDGEQ